MSHEGEEKDEEDKENQTENDEDKDNQKTAENEDIKDEEKDKSNNDEDKNDDDKNKADNAKLFNSFEERIRESFKKEEKSKRQAYNEAVKILGDFNAFGMSAKEIYTKALNSVNITVSGKESNEELSSMLRVANSIKVDNNFNYNQITDNNLEEIEITI